MLRERIADNVYWFQSEIYAQVTAGAVAGPEWAVVIDTLALPDETLSIRTFIEEQLNIPVRYVINTHYHADHTWGNCFFPGATIIAHTDCRQLMIERGQDALKTSRHQDAVYKKVKIILPHLTFSDGELSLRVGKKTLVLFPTPGNSSDGISVFIEEDRVLFAGDVFMPIPFVVDGNLEELCNTINEISLLGLENIVQGHGDIILRGEIEDTINQNLGYLNAINKAVHKAARRKKPLKALAKIDIEACGKSRIILEGLAEELHRRNLNALYLQITEEESMLSNSNHIKSK